MGTSSAARGDVAVFAIVVGSPREECLCADVESRRDGDMLGMRFLCGRVWRIARAGAREPASDRGQHRGSPATIPVRIRGARRCAFGSHGDGQRTIAAALERAAEAESWISGAGRLHVDRHARRVRARGERRRYGHRRRVRGDRSRVEESRREDHRREHERGRRGSFLLRAVTSGAPRRDRKRARHVLEKLAEQNDRVQRRRRTGRFDVRRRRRDAVHVPRHRRSTCKSGSALEQSGRERRAEKGRDDPARSQSRRQHAQMVERRILLADGRRNRRHEGAAHDDRRDDRQREIQQKIRWIAAVPLTRPQDACTSSKTDKTRSSATPSQRETLTRIHASPESPSIGLTRKNEPGEMSTFFWRAAT